jgi:S-adenosylmethionine:tRNA ribosyltransferase-isomerase
LSDEIPGSSAKSIFADKTVCKARSFSEISFETSIYITPGYHFQIVDDLVTNFHLGESSLLVLVSAFLGYDATMQIYKYAIENQYRFYSFGDGVYIRSK